MPRRGGKAANRRSRQRQARAQRPIQRPAPPSPAALDDAMPVPPVGTPDAREAATLEPPKRTSTVSASGPSGLGQQARTEYHYVERDLRNIGVLSAVMAVLLLAAWLVFSLAGAGAG